MFDYKSIKVLALAASLLPAASFAETITLHPGDKVAQIVAAAPAGTSFVFSAGTYRLLQIKPKTGDSFTGPTSGKAVLDGALPIKFSPVPGSSPQLWSSSIGAMPLDEPNCMKGHPLCVYTRELFVDTSLMMPVSSTKELTNSTWYYDAGKGTAVINFDPGTNWFQIGTSLCAFCGYANDVTIQNLTVERYAAPATSGAVGEYAAGSNWTLTNIVGRYNHGGAAMVGDHSTVTNSYFHHNGQKGLGGHGSNLLIQNNEFAYNNYDWFGYSWESGGMKFGHLKNAEILDNYSHDNNGAGLWDDTYCINVHYKGNRVENNAGAGIQHEIGYAATIEDNTLIRNGNPPRISMWNGQVSVQNSSNTIVRGNKVVVAADYGSGLVIVNQQRATTDLYGPTVGTYDTIENNDITFEGTNGAGGLMGIGSTGTNNVIDYNTYHINPALNKHHFEAFGVKTFAQFQEAGYDAHGKVVWSK